MDFINALMPNFERLSGELLECIGQTFTMLAVSGSIAWVLGVAVGVLLTVCRPGGIWKIAGFLRSLIAASTSSVRFRSLF